MEILSSPQVDDANYKSLMASFTAEELEGRLISGLQRARQDGKYSDLRIVCGHIKWDVHRVVVCPQSTFFAKACDGPFIESQTGEIELVDDDPHTVGCMLNFLYSTSYATGPGPNEANGESPAVTHAKVYVLAEKYDIPALKAVANGKFIASLHTNLYQPESFPHAVEIIYMGTTPVDRAVRDAVVTKAHRDRAQLQKQASFMQMLGEQPEFAVDVVKKAWSYADEEKPQVLALDEKMTKKRKAGQRRLFKCYCGGNHQTGGGCNVCGL